MNTFSRGVRNAFRNGVRTVSVVLILALAVGLALAMLVAKQAVEKKISSVKANIGNTITISPAGMSGFGGGGFRAMNGGSGAGGSDQPVAVSSSESANSSGNTLTTSDLDKIKKIAHIQAASALYSTYVNTDQNTNLTSPTPSFSRNGESGATSTNSTTTQSDFKMPIALNGVNDTNGISTALNGATVSLKSGSMIDATSSDLTAVIGDELASENNLSVGSTFTLYGKEIKVVGILNSSNSDESSSTADRAPGRNSSLGSSVVLPLATLQSLSGESGTINKIIATVDNVENTSAATTAITKALGTDSDGNNIADVTSDESSAQTTLDALGGISTTATISLIAAGLAAAVIIFLTMLMIVRERRNEIGVLKAIGAKSRVIITQFVAESLVLTVLASAIGLGIGIVAATPLTNTLVSSAENSNSSESSSNQTTQSSDSGRGGSGNPSEGALSGLARNSSRSIGTVSASIDWTIVLEALGAAVIIAAIGAAGASIFAMRVKPAETIRAE